MRIKDYRIIIKVFDENLQAVVNTQELPLDDPKRTILINKMIRECLVKMKGRANPNALRAIFENELMGYC